MDGCYYDRQSDALARLPLSVRVAPGAFEDNRIPIPPDLLGRPLSEAL